MKRTTLSLFFLCLLLNLFGQKEEPTSNPNLPQKKITATDLETSTNYFWSKDTSYVLEGIVRLAVGGVLTIESGTTILAKDSALFIVSNGAQLIAIGTENEPIIFTSIIEAPEFWEEYIHEKGLWGGLVIEGSPTVYSGHLSYVSISQAGQKVGAFDAAGLVLNGVSAKTKIDHLEVIASGADGIKINGGAVNLSYLTISVAVDDGIDWDNGWQGRGIYWLIYKGGRNGAESLLANFDGSYAIEGNGGREELVKSNPKIYNTTLIGTTCTQFGLETNPSSDGAIHLKGGTQGVIANSAFVHFQTNGIQVEDLNGEFDCAQEVRTGNLTIQNNIWWNFGEDPNSFLADGGILKIAENAEDTKATFLTEHLQNRQNIIAGEGLTLLGTDCPSNSIVLDPRLAEEANYEQFPSANYPNEPFFLIQPPNAQKGAFPTGDLWIENWTFLDKYTSIGDESRGKFFFKQQILKKRDTIRVNCEDQTWVQDSILFYEYFDCDFPGQIASTSRRGNKKRRKRAGNRGGADYAFLEEWSFSGTDESCGQRERKVELTILYYDSIAPAIHLVPDANGILTAFAHDCDEATITKVTRDTFNKIFQGQFVTHTFYAEDYFGNTSMVTVEEKLGGSKDVWYADLDGDGYGNPDLPILLSKAMDGFVSNDLDCNDEDPNAYPSSFYEEESPNIDYECLGQSNYDICQMAAPLEMGIEEELVLFNSNPSIRSTLLDECDKPTIYRDIWFSFKIPSSGGFYLDISDFNRSSSNPNYNISLYEGNCQNLSFLECAIFNKKFGIGRTDFAPETMIYGRIIESTNLNTGAIIVEVKDLLNQQVNDKCSTPKLIEVALTNDCYQDTFSNYGVTILESVFYQTCNFYNAGKDVWFSFTPTTTDTLQITIDTVLGSDFRDPILEIFAGDCMNLKGLACAKSFKIDLATTVTIANPIRNKPILIRVGEISVNDGDFKLIICPKKKTTVSTIVVNDNIGLQVFPNPVRQQQTLNVLMELPEPMNVDITMYNLQGQLVEERLKMALLSGQNIIPIEHSSFSKGLYLLQVRTEKGILTKKVVVR